MHARYCNPNTGRFLSVDPVLGTSLATGSWNRFLYARGNPIRLLDPDGRTIRIAATPGSSEIRNLLIESIRRPTARQRISELALNKKFQATFEAKQFKVNRKSRETLATKRGAVVKIIFGLTTREARQTSDDRVTTGANIALDLSAIQDFHRDPSGIRTLNHEVFHANDIEQGLPDSEVRQGDQPSNATGPASVYGLGILNESPDITTEEATQILDAYLCDQDCNGQNQSKEQ